MLIKVNIKKVINKKLFFTFSKALFIPKKNEKKGSIY